MNYFLTVFLLAALCAFSIAQEHQVSKDKLKEAAMVVVNDCKEKEGASDDDVMALKAHKLPQTEKGICMVQCLFNTVKIMRDGKFSKEGAIDFCTPTLKGDTVKIQKMKDMMDVCEKEIGQEKGCKVAKMIAECMTKHGKEFGFVFPNHIKD